jgi:NB-ARC domain
MRCLMLPKAKTTRIFDRLDLFQQLDQVLQIEAKGAAFRSVALHGLNGVGKSTVAAGFVLEKFNKGVFDVVLWVQGEKLASLRQSFTDIAMRLKLPGAMPQAHDENLTLVNDWLQSTGK